MTQLRTFAVAVAMLALAASCGVVWAQSGGRTIRWIVPYPAGGGSDMVARVLAEAMKADLGDAVIVDNKPGAGTIIGAQALIASPADGLTVMTADSGTLAFNPSLYASLPYKIETSFSYVGSISRNPFVLVTRTGLGVDSVSDLIALAKSRPGKLTYASAGLGTPHHLAMELFQQRTGTKFVHVPYKGGAPALQDILGGQVDLMMLDMPGGISYMKAGRVVMLGVAMPERVALLPNVPTLGEVGVPDFVAYAWQGIVAPAGTPPAVVDRLDAALRKALVAPPVRGKLEDLGILPTPMTGKEFADYAMIERRRWETVIKAAGISLN
ncbi:MAG: tripartite tricarboxylate transporter substrate binding protein [Burkholderiales bacterium]|nr:tripartite tricarboxylate transporter substrate binding protein [Burkholderiales bacterium]